MEVLWGVILLIVMYIAIPVAILAATLAFLGGGERLLPPFLRRQPKNQPE
ncbi:MAG: hypothetical protein ACRDJE_08120 [Dehalococcoidia bacterium]